MIKLHALITVEGLIYVRDGFGDPHSPDLDGRPGTVIIDILATPAIASELKQTIAHALSTYSSNYALMMLDSYIIPKRIELAGIKTGDEFTDRFTQAAAKHFCGEDLQIPDYQSN